MEGGLTGFSQSLVDSHNTDDGGSTTREAAGQEYQQAQPKTAEINRDQNKSGSEDSEYGPNARSAHFQKTGESAEGDVGKENSERSENTVPSSGYAPESKSTDYGRSNPASDIGGGAAEGSADDTAKSMGDNLYSGADGDESKDTGGGPGSDVYGSTKKEGYGDERETPGGAYQGSGDNYGSSGGY